MAGFLTGAGQPVGRAVRLLQGRRRRSALFGLLFVLFGVTASTSPTAVVNDVRAVAGSAWALGVRGTLDLADVGYGEVPWGVERPGGEVFTDRFPGAFLPAVPAYALAPGMPESVDDQWDVPVWPASLMAAAMAAAALVVLHEVLRQELPPRRALGATLVAGLGTSVWTVAADALWTHSSGILLLALVMRSLQREQYVLAGAWLGGAILVRPTHALTALGVGVTLAVVHRRWQRLLEVGLPSMAGLALMSAYSRTLFGTWLPVAGYDPERVSAALGTSTAFLGSYTWADQLLGTLIDRYHGVLPYSPFLGLCAVFVVPAWRRTPSWARACSVGGLLYWIVQLRSNRYTGGHNFFSYRFPIEPLWLSGLVLAHGWFLAVRQRWLRLVGIILVTASLTINAIGAVVFGLRPEPDRIAEPPGREAPDTHGSGAVREP